MKTEFSFGPRNTTATAIYYKEYDDGRGAEYKSLRKNLVNAINQAKFCGICLSTESALCGINDPISIDSWEKYYFTSLKVVLDTLFGGKVPEILCSMEVCEDCKTKAIQAFQFIETVKSSAETIADYIKQLDERIAKANTSVDVLVMNTFENTILFLTDPTVVSDGLKVEAVDCSENEEKYNSSEITIGKKGHWKNKYTRKYKPHYRNYVCDYCGRICRTRAGIMHHIKLHLSGKSKVEGGRRKTYEEIFECSECEEAVCKHTKYILSYKHQFDTQRGIKVKRMKCLDCNFIYSTKNQLIRHVNQDHLDNIIAICEVCTQNCYSKADFKEHMAKHYSNPSVCKLCGRKYNDRANYDKHIKLCEQMEKDFQCSYCPKAFVTKLCLTKHERKHTMQYECRKCYKCFITEQLLENHLCSRKYQFKKKNVRTLRRDYHCSICHKKFLSYKEEKEHLLTHDPLEKHICHICNSIYNTRKQYLHHLLQPKHIKKVDPTRSFKNVACNFCNYKTYHNNLLELHVNQYHLKEKPYVCNHCDERFYNKSKLNRHFKTNHSSDAKLYICDICGNNFSCSSSLQKHRRLHTGEKPYKCPQCDERFLSASRRTVHVLRIHTERSYKCPLCSLMHATMQNMRLHCKKVHWKFKGEKFDIRKIKGLTEEQYDMFRDRRLPQIVDEDNDKTYKLYS